MLIFAKINVCPKNNVNYEICRICDGKGCDTKECDPFMQRVYLNNDMGLRFKFETDEWGKPIGCKGLNDADCLNHKREYSPDHECPLNDDLVDGGALEMHEIVKLYAENNQMWVNEFSAVFEKMLENGYLNDKKNKPLKVANDYWYGLVCDGPNNNPCRPATEGYL